jgi:hypothetical protein
MAVANSDSVVIVAGDRIGRYGRACPRPQHDDGRHEDLGELGPVGPAARKARAGR